MIGLKKRRHYVKAGFGDGAIAAAALRDGVRVLVSQGVGMAGAIA